MAPSRWRTNPFRSNLRLLLAQSAERLALVPIILPCALIARWACRAPYRARPEEEVRLVFQLGASQLLNSFNSVLLQAFSSRNLQYACNVGAQTAETRAGC